MEQMDLIPSDSPLSDSSRARLEQIRAEAIAEAQIEIARMMSEAAHLPASGFVSSKEPEQEQPIETPRSESSRPTRYALVEIEDGNETQIETYSTHALAELAKANRIQEFGITNFRIKPVTHY